jgi:LCP family protein required for cell wall assembly
VTQVAPHSARHQRREQGSPPSGPPGAFPALDRPQPPAGSLRGRHATGYDQGFGGVVTWTILGSLLPGSGLIAAGRRTVGKIILTITLLAAIVAIAFVVLGDTTASVLRFATNTNDLLLLAGGAVGLGLVWAFVVLGTHVSLRRFATMTGPQRALSTLLVTSIIAGGAMIAAETANYSLIGRTTLKAITDNGVETEHSTRPLANQPDPWADTPRVNVLLIGSDAGADRTGVRTDSVILASIDTHTGDTVLFGIPRNLQHVPFPPGTPMAAQYPDGFYCQNTNDPCLFNALWQFGVTNAGNSYYKNFKNPGLQATIDGVQQVTGLPVNEYFLLDLNGFKAFVNAIGGIDVNVKRPIPVAGHEDASGRQVGVKEYIKPGHQHLNGYYALWYARSRSDSSDYDRMQRQRCVIGAISQQTNPVVLARAFPELARAVQKDMSTSVRLDDVSAWVTLLLRVKNAHIRSLPFTDANINTANPNFAYMKRKVQEAITTPSPEPSASRPSGSATSAPKASATTPSSTSKPRASASATTPSDPGSAVDVKQAC